MRRSRTDVGKRACVDATSEVEVGNPGQGVRIEVISGRCTDVENFDVPNRAVSGVGGAVKRDVQGIGTRAAIDDVEWVECR